MARLGALCFGVGLAVRFRGFATSCAEVCPGKAVRVQADMAGQAGGGSMAPLPYRERLRNGLKIHNQPE
jgi:hypothetical protein